MSESTNEETEEPSPVGPTASEESDETVSEGHQNQATQESSRPVRKTKWTDSLRNFFSSGSHRNHQEQAATDEVEAAHGTTDLVEQHSDYSVLTGVYNNKKTLANNLMDFAFLTANANQLHNAVNSTYEGRERIVSIVLISLSMTLQIATGFLLIIGSYIQSKWKSVKDEEQPNSSRELISTQRRLDWFNKIDHLTLSLVFLIAIINVFIAAFSTPQVSTTSPPTES